MRLRAVVIILRKDGFFHTGEAIIHRSYDNFTGFPHKQVPAVRRFNGWGVALVLRTSQVDADFGAQTLFLEEQHLRVIEEAFHKSDELTHDLLGHGWNGVRPFWKLEDFM
ncbi:hypothetical protein G4O51_12280 [Candidatus Bathyarchaeota archaeon A05DMB-2]|jgi:hypothetical protein|nr:hypothetical protein [Candidatus Bathyarchaeota archaeon A05DMB-2]